MGHATNGLYLNKLYASCRDAENKKNGIVAIMSAYQAYLWDTGKINMIRRDEANDNCGYILRRNPEGIIQHLLLNPGVFHRLIEIINGFVATDVLGMVIPIREINAHDILLSRIANAVPASLNTFLVFSWFITSVFGVKTKSKPSKIISLGRTYLRLLIDSPPREPRPFPLFGLPINIPAAPAVAPVAVGAMIDGHGQPVGIATGREQDRLCLAYSSDRIFGMAIEKYIKMDIDMIVEIICVTFTNFVTSNPDHHNDPKYAADFIDINKDNISGVFAQILGDSFPANFLNFQNAYTTAYSRNTSVEEARKAASAFFKTVFAPRCQLFVGQLQHVKQVPPFQLVIQQPQQAEEQPQPQEQRVMVYPLSVAITSPVFNQEIFSELITRFSHLPRGNEYILGAARYMRPIMLQICGFIDGGNVVNITQYMNSIRELPYPYRPALHDTSKFTMLNDGMRNAWLQYLINKILLGENNQTIFDNMKLFVLLYNYIVSGDVWINATIRKNIIYRTAIGALIDEHFKVCDIGTRRKREEAAEEVEVPTPAPADAKKRRQLGGTIRFRNPSSPKKTNNHTRRNKNNRKKNSKSKTKTKFKTKSSPKHRKAIPSSRSGSQSNRKKSKPKKSKKNVTFKRRRARK